MLWDWCDIFYGNDEHLASFFVFMYSKTNTERTVYFFAGYIWWRRESLPSLSFAPFRSCFSLNDAERSSLFDSMHFNCNLS